MKKARFLLALVFLFCLVCAAAHAETQVYNGLFVYTLEKNGTVTLEQYIGSDSVVAVPETIAGAPVRRLSNHAFADRVDVRVVYLPDQIDTVDDGCFAVCPARVYAGIGSNTAKSLSISGYAFCAYGYPDAALKYSFTAAGTVADLEASVKSFDSTEVAIPRGVTAIASGGFYDCTELIRITIPEGVTMIKANAFEGCKKLRSVTLPESLVSIQSRAFKGCSSLLEITLPGGLTSITPSAVSADSWPFVDCPARLYVNPSSTTAVTISKANQYFQIIGYPYAALHWQFDADGNKAVLAARAVNADITEAVIPSGVKVIEQKGFADCAELKTLTIPDSVIFIAQNALPKKAETLNVGCTSYARDWAAAQNYARDTDESASPIKYHVNHSGYIYPNPSVSPTETTPGQTGGTHCSVCGEVFVPSRIIPALRDMNTLYLPAGLESIEGEAFIGLACSAVIIPDGCREIGSMAFANCRNLIYVRIPLSVSYIASDAFTGCAEGLIQDYTLH